jgi:radical SAM enzyme (TIGR01210 family)
VKLSPATFAYPAAPEERSRWIVSRRGAKAAVDPARPYAFLLENERGPAGGLLPTATIFLTNRECPWRCVMCDLWRNTTDATVPAGAIPAQIESALAQMPRARQVKLYNSGSFFDPSAIPPEGLPRIAELARGYERVIVECHPSLVLARAAEIEAFAARLDGQLEIAMGLETAHPDVLEKMNKRMTLAGFENAARALQQQRIDLRVFALVNPPFMPPAEAPAWVERTIDFGLECNAAVVALIPTRAGNGAMDELARQGQFAEPKIAEVEAAQEYGLRAAAGRAGARVFADLWDLRRFSKCPHCFSAREARLHQMNCGQQLLPRVACDCKNNSAAQPPAKAA